MGKRSSRKDDLKSDLGVFVPSVMRYSNLEYFALLFKVLLYQNMHMTRALIFN